MSIIDQTNRHYSTNICKENTDMQCVFSEVKIIGKVLLYDTKIIFNVCFKLAPIIPHENTSTNSK